MPFIEHQEALGLPCPADANVAPSIPFQPFPFLKLPREIRDSIYYYALIRPDTVRSAIPLHISSVQPRVSNPSRTAYGGTEKSTRLFRVNHQVSDEALELFYSSFPLYLPHYLDVALVNATLRETLSARARSLIGSIGLIIILSCSSGPSTDSEEENLRQALEAVVQLLPYVRRVELSVTFIGFAVPENEVKEVVTRAIRVASPLKDIALLVFRGVSIENAQQMRIIREVREALGCL